jgi:signal-transduction protein with cAMP-binding, CBS, and nucleotidyltransferase domain
MAQPFDANNAPFNRLSLEELGIVRDALDIGYFRPGETIIARDRTPESLFIVIKGSVESAITMKSSHCAVQAMRSTTGRWCRGEAPMPSSLARRRCAACCPAT